MALEFRMRADKVEGTGGKRWEPCDPDDDGAVPIADAGVGSVYGPPQWLRDATHLRMVDGQVQENFVLNCVRNNDPDDPGGLYFNASPWGEFKSGIDNPAAWGYLQPGEVYRVTIEKIRGPRSKEREEMAQEAEQAARG